MNEVTKGGSFNFLAFVKYNIHFSSSFFEKENDILVSLMIVYLNGQIVDGIHGYLKISTNTS